MLIVQYVAGRRLFDIPAICFKVPFAQLFHIPFPVPERRNEILIFDIAEIENLIHARSTSAETSLFLPQQPPDRLYLHSPFKYCCLKWWFRNLQSSKVNPWHCWWARRLRTSSLLVLQLRPKLKSNQGVWKNYPTRLHHLIRYNINAKCFPIDKKLFPNIHLEKLINVLIDKCLFRSIMFKRYSFIKMLVWNIFILQISF